MPQHYHYCKITPEIIHKRAMRTPRMAPGRLAHPWLIIAGIVFGMLVIGSIVVRVVALEADTLTASRLAPAQGVTSAHLSHNKLYILSHIPDPTGADMINPVAGRVTILDLATRQTIRSITTAPGVDVAAAPDGTRLYVSDRNVQAHNGAGEDQVYAIDTASGRELWRQAIDNRVKYMFGDGPSTMALSADGRWLYV